MKQKTNVGVLAVSSLVWILGTWAPRGAWGQGAESVDVRAARQELARVEATRPQTLEAAAAVDALVSALIQAGAQANPETQELAERALRTKEKLLPPDDMLLVPSLTNLADILKWNSKWKAAQVLYERVLRIRTLHQNANHPDAATTCDALGIVLMQQGENEQARTYFERSKRIRIEAFGPDDAHVATSLHFLGIVLKNSGDYEGSRAAYEQALQIRRQKLPPGDPAIGATLSNLGSLYHEMRQFAEARRLYEEALRIYKEAGEEVKAAETMNNMGNLLKLVGDLAEARIYCEKALEIRRRRLGETSPFVGTTLKNLAELDAMSGNYPEALARYNQVLGIWEKAYGREHRRVAECLREKGNLLDVTGDHRGAGDLLREATDILERVLGPDHPDVAFTVSWLASHHATMQEYEAAESLFRRALQIRQQSAEDRVDLAWAQIDLAGVLGHLHKSAEAKSLYESGLDGLEASLGAEHYDVARALHAQGQFLVALGDVEPARSCFERAAEILATTMGQSCPLRAPVLADLAIVQEQLGQSKRAFDTAQQAVQIDREYLLTSVRGFPEGRALGFLATQSTGLDQMVAHAIRRGNENRDLIERAWNAVIRNRAQVLDEVARQHRDLERPSDPEIQRLAADLRTTRQQLANLAVRGPGMLSLDEYKRLLAETEKRNEELGERLSLQNGSSRRADAVQDPCFADVREALPSGSALVAYWRYEPGPRKLESSAPHPAADLAQSRNHTGSEYAAFILRSGHPEPAIVSVGRGDDIERAVELWRTQVSPAFQKIPDDKATRLAGEQLRGRVWDPIQPHIRGVRRVFVVPEGALQFVTLAALPGYSQPYLVEEGPMVHYLSAERDLVVAAGKRTGKGILVLGDPDFQAREALLRSDDHHGEETTSSGPEDAAPAETFSGTRSGCAGFDSTMFKRLPISRLEAQDVAALWTAENDSAGSPILLLGARASEGAFKRFAPGRRILHFATHGFFLGVECEPTINATRATGGLALSWNDAAPVARENPLLHSGIVLGGANFRTSAAPNEEDGILTAEEIALVDLRGVEWAVISACDTGLGEVVSGEGVLGLRRAFHVAGAATLITSLWPVYEQPSRVWMRAAYEARLRRGAPTDAAVHQATLETLQWCRTNAGSDHPSLWAAFVATGAWN